MKQVSGRSIHSMEEFSKLSPASREELFMHIPQVLVIWKPYIPFIPWWGRWVGPKEQPQR